jgi:hypothetical protein
MTSLDGAAAEKALIGFVISTSENKIILRKKGER